MTSQWFAACATSLRKTKIQNVIKHKKRGRWRIITKSADVAIHQTDFPKNRKPETMPQTRSFEQKVAPMDLQHRTINLANAKLKVQKAGLPSSVNKITRKDKSASEDLNLL